MLWDHCSLSQRGLPTALMRASLLLRTAERCQRHALREAVHVLWKRCALKRSMEEMDQSVYMV